MAKERSVVDNAVHFGDKVAASGLFKTLFRDGMALVEETAAYLDGAGRDDAKILPRMAALAYASESMRLTTRLMQIASWLLLQRAVNEGEMSQVEAASDKRRTRLAWQYQPAPGERRRGLAAAAPGAHRQVGTPAGKDSAARSDDERADSRIHHPVRPESGRQADVVAARSLLSLSRLCGLPHASLA